MASKRKPEKPKPHMMRMLMNELAFKRDMDKKPVIKSKMKQRKTK